MAARLLKREVVIRELMPEDLKIEISRLTQQKQCAWRAI
jgi:Zn-dependent M32 family carboxypeptidase